MGWVMAVKGIRHFDQITVFKTFQVLFYFVRYTPIMFTQLQSLFFPIGPMGI